MPSHVRPREHGSRTTTLPLVHVRSRQAVEDEIRRQVEAERVRLEAMLPKAPAPRAHFRRPVERPLTAAERDHVTLLIGGLTWKHDALNKAAFELAGYKVEVMPIPDVAGFQAGKEYGNNGQCNPTYFLVGHLINFLKTLEERGLSRQEIIDKYVFFTAGACGPCRFGMYESEYRLAVQNAGFDGFRVLLFHQADGVKAASGEPGLKFTADLGLAALTGFNVADILNDLAYQIRPFEVNPGETDRVIQECMDGVTTRIRERKKFELREELPEWMVSRLGRFQKALGLSTTLGKVYQHLLGSETREMLHEMRDRLGRVQVDRLRVKPVVKVTGEFWAQTTEGDGNFHMFQFLEREGAQVIVEPLGTWIMYMLWLAKATFESKKGLDWPRRGPWALHRRLGDELKFHSKRWSFEIGRGIYTRQYARTVREMGGLAHPLVRLEQLAALAAPYYNVLSKGGEGHMEVAKNIYYTIEKKCHMVLSLKPFGCMPSTQSDGVQSAVMSHFKDMIFLPIETSGEGEVNAHSRVQMALGEARAKARTEFEQATAATGKSLAEVHAFVDRHPVLRHPFYAVPHRSGVTATAAHFVLHVGDLMDGRVGFNRVPAPQRPRRRRWAAWPAAQVNGAEKGQA